AGYSNDDDNTDTARARDVFAVIAAERQDVLARALGDAKRLASASSVQARCLECAGFADTRASSSDLSLVQMLIKAVWP
ncbi:MAG: hypothetical protein JSR79_02715, partial [Proteobacteria bacterium]|nr:hypothetical protein [Pseudomonadota bacterium]